MAVLVGCGADAAPEPAAEGPVVRTLPSDDPNAPLDPAEPSQSIAPQRLRDSEPGKCTGQTVFCWPFRGGCWLVGTHCSDSGVLMCEYQCPPIVIEY